MNATTGTINEVMLYAVVAISVLLLLVYIIALILFVKLSNMKKKYKAMMQGTNSQDLEMMLLEHINEVKKVMQQNTQIEEEHKQIHEILQNVIQKIGIVRFSAFDDVGGDLSYAVAILDRQNTGVIFSSIFGRNASMSYMKPVRNGNSKQKLSDEENEALRKAMAK